MPVFGNHKLVHIHIPKTAGTAIEKVFRGLGEKRPDFGASLGPRRRGGRWYEPQHLSISELHDLSWSRYERYASFAVVRDPYERLLSDFRWRKVMKRSYPQARIRAFDSFKDFLRAIPPDIDSGWERLIDDASREEANLLIHLRPQYQYVCDREGARLVDDTLRFEHLAREMTLFLFRYGELATGIRSPQRRSIDEDYDRGMLDFVNEAYARDFAELSYAMR